MSLQQVANGIFQGSVYALFALGYTLIFGVLDILNLAHAAIFMAAAAVAWALVTTHGWSLWLAFPLVVAGAGMMGVLLDRIAFAPLRRRQSGPLSQMISSLALATVIEGVTLGTLGPNLQRFPPSSFPSGSLTVLGVHVDVLQIIVLSISLLLMIGLQYLLRRTWLGRAMRAIAENKEAAALLGVPVEAVIATTFFIASALGGASGILYGMSFNAVSFDMGHRIELRGLAIIILGGMGSIPGSLIGGFALGLVEVISTAWRSDLRDAVAFSVLLVVLVVRPTGLFGTHDERQA